MMRTLLAAAAVLLPLSISGSAVAGNSYAGAAGEYNEIHRRPVDMILINKIADHTYALKYCTSLSGCTTGWTCGESFGGTCDCSSYSTTGTYPNNCTIDNGAWEQNGSLWGFQCASWLGGRTYGTWGVCHQASANMQWYALGGPGNMPNDVRGWAASVGAYGTYGSDGGAGCY